MKNVPLMGTMVMCLMLSLTIVDSGCKKGTSVADAATDPNNPANANVVPVSNSTGGTASDNTSATSPAAPSSDQSASAPTSTAPAGDQSASGTASTAPQTAQSNQDNGYGEEPETYASQAPPPLPQYEQPPAPQEGDLWTPGYWAYAQPAGYYWVPGAWVQAPYVGALWTPGYWGWRGGRYAFYRGYWGRHIGYYGGINYGFGYVGFGYQGGYWRGNVFAYNTAVVRVNTEVIRNVYNYRITNVTVNRVSYNGPGGVQYRPRVSEIYAVREEHTPPMAAQLQIRETAMGNRETFYNVNQGRPAAVVETRTVVADRDVRQPAVVHYERGERPAEVMRPMPEPQHPEMRPGAEEHRPEAHPAPAEHRPEARPAEQHKPGAHPEQRPDKERPR